MSLEFGLPPRQENSASDSADNAPPNSTTDPMPVETAPASSSQRVVIDAEQPQLQSRLLNLALQIEQIQQQLATLLGEVESNGSQVNALTQHLTDLHSSDAIQQQLAELAAAVTTQQEQMTNWTQALSQVARQEQVMALLQRLDQTAQQEQVSTLARMLEQLARQEQVSQLLQQMVSREQVERLLQVVAEREQLASLDDALKKLTRTQFKTNALGESKEQQIEGALNTLRELANRRQQVEQNQLNRNAQQLREAASNSRAEFAAELLPALDSLQLALENGDSILQRHTQKITSVVNQQQEYVAALAHQPSAIQLAPRSGFWQRLFQSDDPLPLPAAPDPLPAEALQATFQEANEAMRAWLNGLNLVRDRFQSLLATEGIQEIEALHQPFDPRLHVAVDTDQRSDLPANHVAQVVRKGYRQHNRVLRYAEVVVARRS